ncbi:MAG: hypothetical protein ACRD6X_11345 [Pyrinomonadaceae bacterium]
MNTNGFNWQIWVGLLLCLFGLVSYPLIFAQLESTRNEPWLNLILFAIAFVFVFIGLRRAFATGYGKISKIVTSILALVGVASLGLFVFAAFVAATWLPKSTGAPHVGQKAHDFTLADTGGKNVSLAVLLADKKGVLLVFYRGYW